VIDNDRLLKLQPDDFRAYYNRGLALAELDNLSKALADFNQALHWASVVNAPNLAEIYSDRGLVQARLRHWQEAIGDLNQSIRLDPTRYQTFHNRGCVREQQGDYQAAVQDFTMALRLNPTYASTYVNRAIAHLKLNQKPLALKDLRQASAYFLAEGSHKSYQQVMALMQQVEPEAPSLQGMANL
ncbi:MAG: tetratricopeptide repeat protein, partial [Leptolyngbyaceae cyanobacterium bins.59]|nr:tetratricopeptide repeat protein [Leptolyngbyaceae cyanobacterium bins.59]